MNMVVENKDDEKPAGSLFKKKKKIPGFKKAKARGRIRSRLSDDDDESEGDGSDHNEESAMDAIISAKKKRKLLNSVLGKNRRGLDASLLMQSKSASQSEHTDTGPWTKKKDLTKRLEGNFSGGGDAGDGSGDTVMQRKHRDAMEEFIRENMKTDTGETDEATAKSKQKPTDVESQLYEELASSAVAMSLKASNDDMMSNPTQDQEGDVGAGGAMLGGTGIAEVELPVEDRIKTARATQEAAAARERARQRQVLDQTPPQIEPSHESDPEQMLPMSFSVGMGKRSKKMVPSVPLDAQDAGSIVGDKRQMNAYEDGPTASSAGVDVLRSDVLGLGSSYSQNYRLHTHEWVAQKKQQQDTEAEVARQQQIDDLGPAANQERMGFEAARRAARGESPLQSGPAGGSSSVGGDKRPRDYQQRSSDDRAFKNFVQKTRR